MNTTQIDEVLSKYVKYFEGLYPIDILLSTLTKPSIIVINVDKYYMPGSNSLAVRISECGYAEYF